MRHRDNLEGYDGTLADLAQELGNLRYDALALFLKELAAKLTGDAANDAERKRPRLAGELNSTSEAIRTATEALERAWRICAPYMGD